MSAAASASAKGGSARGLCRSRFSVRQRKIYFENTSETNCAAGRGGTKQPSSLPRHSLSASTAPRRRLWHSDEVRLWHPSRLRPPPLCPSFPSPSQFPSPDPSSSPSPPFPSPRFPSPAPLPSASLPSSSLPFPLRSFLAQPTACPRRRPPAPNPDLPLVPYFRLGRTVPPRRIVNSVVKTSVDASVLGLTLAGSLPFPHSPLLRQGRARSGSGSGGRSGSGDGRPGRRRGYP